MLKHWPITVIEYMHTLFNIKCISIILRQKCYLPKTWGEAIISPLFKKGSPNDTKNYRGISLLSCIGKTLTKILNNRLMFWVELMGTLDGQGAYRCHRSTNNNIFTFVDFSQAFDSIPHRKLWYRLISEGLHGRILKLLRSMYSKFKLCVKTPGGLTEWFDCLIGTRQ